MESWMAFTVKLYRRGVIFLDIALFFINSLLAYLRAIVRLFVSRTKYPIDGEIILVTGSGSGIGRELALQLGKLNSVIVCVDVSDEANEATALEIQRNGGSAFHYHCDVSKREEVDQLARQIKAEVGEVTILINNAGIRWIRPFLQQTPNQIEKTINVNLLGQMWMSRAFLPEMVKRNKGTIVALCALSGYGGFPNTIPFNASKFGVRGFMESLYLELRQENPGHKIHLMTVAPFSVDTGMLKGTVVRFPGLISVVKGEEAARIIIENMMRKETVVFIPGIYYYIQNLIRILPLRVQLLITDFLDTGVEIHYDNHDD